MKRQLQNYRGRGRGRGRGKGRPSNPLQQVSQDKQVQDADSNNKQQQKSQVKQQQSQIKQKIIQQNKQPIKQQIVLKKPKGRKGSNKELNIKPENQIKNQYLKPTLNQNQQGLLFTYKLVQSHNDKHQKQISQKNQIIDQEKKKQEDQQLPKQQESIGNKSAIKAIATKGRRRGPNKQKILNQQSEANLINQNQIAHKKQDKQNSDNQNSINLGNINVKNSQNQQVKKTKKISKNINSKSPNNNNNPKKGLQHFKKYYNQVFAQQKIYTETPLIFSKFSQPQQYKELIKKIQIYQRQNIQNQRRK